LVIGSTTAQCRLFTPFAHAIEKAAAKVALTIVVICTIRR